jgi:chromosome segregation ATPase
MAEEINKEDTTKKLTEDPLKQVNDRLDRLSGEFSELKDALRQFMARDTNRLPKDYDARFSALEGNLAEFQRDTNARLAALEQGFSTLEHNLTEFRRDTKRNFKSLQETYQKEERQRFDLEERIEMLEADKQAAA